MLRDQWSWISESADEDREFCEWSARLGLDPHDTDELTDDQAETIATLISPLEDSVRNDLLDAAQLRSLQADLEWLDQARSLAADAGGSVHPAPTLSKVEGRTAHESGYACATALRHHLCSSDECEPIGDMDEFLHRLGWAQSPSRTLGLGPEGPLKWRWSKATTARRWRWPLKATRRASGSGWQGRSFSDTSAVADASAGWSRRPILGSSGRPARSPQSSWRPRRACRGTSGRESHTVKSTTWPNTTRLAPRLSLTRFRITGSPGSTHRHHLRICLVAVPTGVEPAPRRALLCRATRAKR